MKKIFQIKVFNIFHIFKKFHNFALDKIGYVICNFEKRFLLLFSFLSKKQHLNILLLFPNNSSMKVKILFYNNNSI